MRRTLSTSLDRSAFLLGPLPPQGLVWCPPGSREFALAWSLTESLTLGTLAASCLLLGTGLVHIDLTSLLCACPGAVWKLQCGEQIGGRERQCGL